MDKLVDDGLIIDSDNITCDELVSEILKNDPDKDFIDRLWTDLDAPEPL